LHLYECHPQARHGAFQHHHGCVDAAGHAAIRVLWLAFRPHWTQAYHYDRYDLWGAVHDAALPRPASLRRPHQRGDARHCGCRRQGRACRYEGSQPQSAGYDCAYVLPRAVRDDGLRSYRRLPRRAVSDQRALYLAFGALSHCSHGAHLLRGRHGPDERHPQRKTDGQLAPCARASCAKNPLGPLPGGFLVPRPAITVSRGLVWGVAQLPAAGGIRPRRAGGGRAGAVLVHPAHLGPAHWPDWLAGEVI
nr:hypothetical protein [Tanacetum cinerariifolium]